MPEHSQYRPVMRRGEIWFLQDVLAALRISNATLKRWQQIRPDIIGRPGTSSAYVISDDIFEIMRIDAADAPRYIPDYQKQKA